MDGIAFAPSGDLFAIHIDGTGAGTIFRINPDADPYTVTVLRNTAQIATDLGFTGSVIFESGMASSPDGRYVYFAASDSSDIDGEITLAVIDSATAPYTATVVASGSETEDMQDFTVMASGSSHVIVAVRGADGTGIIDPFATTPSFELKVTEAALQAILGTSDSVPVETVAVNPTTGRVFVFAHQIEELFTIDDILTSTPDVQRLVIADWPGNADFHDLAVTASGVLVGFDEASPASIKIWDGTTAYSFDLDDLGDSIELDHDHKSVKHGPGGEFEPALWRGIVAKDGPDNTVILYVAAQGDEYGIVEFTFGVPASSGPLSATDWNLYQ
jgi:DNA-binding beta-propeller fold protein YncE